MLPSGYAPMLESYFKTFKSVCNLSENKTSECSSFEVYHGQALGKSVVWFYSQPERLTLVAALM